MKIQLDAKQNNIDAVIADYLRLTKLYPDKKEFKTALAKIYSQADRKQDAENVLREMVKAEPLDIARKVVLLDFLNSLGKERAISQLQKYSDENKNEPEVLFEMGQWLYEKSYLAEAKTLLTKIDNLDKSSESYQQIKLLLAKVSFQNKELDEANVLIDELINHYNPLVYYILCVLRT